VVNSTVFTLNYTRSEPSGTGRRRLQSNEEEFEGNVKAALVDTLNKYGTDLVPQRTSLGGLLGPTFFDFEYPTLAGLPILCEVTVVEDPSPDLNERLYAGEVLSALQTTYPAQSPLAGENVFLHEMNVWCRPGVDGGTPEVCEGPVTYWTPPAIAASVYPNPRPPPPPPPPPSPPPDVKPIVPDGGGGGGVPVAAIGGAVAAVAVAVVAALVLRRWRRQSAASGRTAGQTAGQTLSAGALATSLRGRGRGQSLRPPWIAYPVPLPPPLAPAAPTPQAREGLVSPYSSRSRGAGGERGGSSSPGGSASPNVPASGSGCSSYPPTPLSRAPPSPSAPSSPGWLDEGSGADSDGSADTVHTANTLSTAGGAFSRFELVSWEEVELGELIGSGAAGDVYRAEYSSTDVACKLLRRKKRMTAKEMSYLVEECRLALKLRHPNVLLTLGLVSDGARNHAILTELMDITLDELIESAPRSASLDVPPPAEGRGGVWGAISSTFGFSGGGSSSSDAAKGPTWEKPTWEKPYLTIANEVARGMSYLHNHRVIHRDLKPGNVLLKLPMMTAKVADFGASRDFAMATPEGPEASAVESSAGSGNGRKGLAFSSMNMTMSMAGTPVYMAPEVLRQDRYGKPADVWSFGGLLVHIATGQPPFFALLQAGLAPLRLMQAISSGELTPASRIDEQPDVLLRPDWPDAVARIAEECFEFDPAARPTFEQVAWDLQELWLETHPGASVSRRRSERPGPPRRSSARYSSERTR